jgi:hypothetical protein
VQEARDDERAAGSLVLCGIRWHRRAFFYRGLGACMVATGRLSDSLLGQKGVFVRGRRSSPLSLSRS